MPVWQVVLPTWQGSLGAQLLPAMQLMHAPALQTLLFPHEVPFVTFPVSVQTEAPVVQDVVPVRHAVAGVQLTPGMQVPQTPPLQTLFVPHEVPSARFFPVSAQSMSGEQTDCPA